jgi:hypothetical protein
MNCVFVRDLIVDRPFSHPAEYARNYYAKYPAIAVLHWPPLFYSLEAILFLIDGEGQLRDLSPRECVARYERCFNRQQKVLNLKHYLRVAKSYAENVQGIRGLYIHNFFSFSNIPLALQLLIPIRSYLSIQSSVEWHVARCTFRVILASTRNRFIAGKHDLPDSKDHPAPIYKITQDARVTLVGQFIRKTSLDELPQFFNVPMGICHWSGRDPRSRSIHRQWRVLTVRLSNLPNCDRVAVFEGENLYGPS